MRCGRLCLDYQLLCHRRRLLLPQLQDRVKLHGKDQNSLQISLDDIGEKSTTLTIPERSASFFSINVLLYQIVSPNDGIFEIDPFNGSITLARKLDFEECSRHTITVVCTDGWWSASTLVHVSVANVNDESPVIHNPPLSFISSLHFHRSYFLYCTDADNLDALNYGVRTDPSSADHVAINASTGEIWCKKDSNQSIMGEFYCSDGIHITRKNVTIHFFSNRALRSSMSVSVSYRTDNIVMAPGWMSAKQSYRFFLQPSEDRTFKEDWIYFQIEQLTGELKKTKYLRTPNRVYKVSVTALPAHAAEAHLYVDLSISYDHTASCRPAFVRTPYSYKILYPVTKPRKIGTSSVRYCLGSVVEYYLSSGHSYFSVNVSTGDILINRSPPQGHYLYKLTAVIYGPSKIYISTTFTAITVNTEAVDARCQFDAFRFFVNATDPPGMTIGNVVIKYLPLKVEEISFSLPNSHLFTINNEGVIFVAGNLTAISQRNLNYSVIVKWSKFLKEHSIKCRVIIEISRKVTGCSLYLEHPGDSVDLVIPSDLVPGSFIFSLPVAHADCELQSYETRYKLTDPNFTIDLRKGNITSNKNLPGGQYSFAVIISSPHSRRDLEVPVTVLGVPRLRNTEISFQANMYSYTVHSDIALGSLLGAVSATFTSVTLQSSLRYSIVSFCCVFPSNIAVYNGSIRQSPFHIVDQSGRLYVQDSLSALARIYTMVVRAYISTTFPDGYQFKDVNVVINVIAPACACKHRSFKVSIAERSKEGVTLLEDVLVLNQKESLVVTLQPESARKHFKYDLLANTISTTSTPLDFEEFRELELILTIGVTGMEILRCRGVVVIVDTNDNAPRFLRNYFIGFISENSPPNSWIIDVEVTDADSQKFPLTLSLSGYGNECFRIDSLNGSVFSTKKLDREQRDHYNLKIRVSDGVHALETGMLIHVVDANDNTPQISSSVMNATVVINKSGVGEGNFTVATISATDADDPISNNSRIFCELVPSSVLARKILALNSSTCQVTIDPKFAHLISPNLTLAMPIIVRDKGEPSLSNCTFLRIHFVDGSSEMRISNDSLQNPIAVLYTSPRGTSLFSLRLSNKNGFSNVLFGAVRGNGSSYFSVNSESGQISTKESLMNLPMGGCYSLYIQACGINRNSKLAQCSNVARVDFIICDFNLHSPEITVDPATVSIPQNFEIRKRLAKVRVVDKDEGLSGIMKVQMDESSALTFSLLDSLERNVYELVITTPLDYERQRWHAITLMVRDLGSPSRSQTVTVTVVVADSKGNAPYFLQNHLIVRLSNPQSPLILPLAQGTQTASSNRFSVSPPLSVIFLYVEDRLEAYIQKSFWNLSSLQITVSVTDGKVDTNRVRRFNQLKVYIIMGRQSRDIFVCPVGVVSSTDLQYHILTVRPRSSKHQVRINQRTGQLIDASSDVAKDILLSVSRTQNLDVQYKICPHHSPGSDATTDTRHKLIVPQITIEKSIEKGTEVARIVVLENGENVSRKFSFSLRSNFFFPFNCLNKRDAIISSRYVDAEYNSWYSVTVIARHRNTSLVMEILEGNILIKVGASQMFVAKVDLSLRVREMEGHGVVIGSIQEMVQKHYGRRWEGENYVLEGGSKSTVVMDIRGVIRVSGYLDRELQGRLVIYISSRYTRVIMTILIGDENDSLSEARKTNVIVDVERRISNVGMVAHIVPVDKDIVGDYQCRFDSLYIPRGVLVTPDCWLYVIDSSALFNQTSVVTVLQHDGVHPAVKSVFYLDIRGKYFATKDNDWLLLVLSTFELVHVLPRLKLLKDFLLSVKITHFLVGLNPLERHIIIRVNNTTGLTLKGLLGSHRTRIEQILNETTIQMASDICNVDSCYLHGSCSSVLRTDYEQMFTDDDQRQRGEIHVYPSMVLANVCSCWQGYLGTSCNISATCPYQICHNGGTCGQDLSGQTICECSTGFSGDRCDQDVNECNYSKWCGINGKCVNVLGGYKCECNLEWSGTSLCNRPFNHCQSSQCSSPGTSQCIPVIGGFECRCAFGYYGDKCTLYAVSLSTQSIIQWELPIINSVSLEFATISSNAPLLKVLLHSSLQVHIVITVAKIRLSLANQNQVLQHRQSNMEVANGEWIKLDLVIDIDKLSLRIAECGNLGDCERTTALYGGITRPQETLVIRTSFPMPLKQVTVTLGNEESPRLVGQRFFVGCIRNMEILNVSAITRKESNVLYDSCPRFINDVAPCGNAVEKCGRVGDCIDEWFSGRCTCPEGYQPPSCSPGFPAFSLSPNTVISFLQRPEFASRQNRRQKRQVPELISEISLRIKTRDVNSILMLSLSSLHTYTLVQISNGMVKIVDKFAGSSQEIVHRASMVNDNKVHLLIISRSSLGRLSVTVDSIVAVIEWLQSHDPLGSSVQTIHVAGVPNSDRGDELLDLPNFSGCLSEVRFNNVTQPLQGVTERFNVSVVQGHMATGCSSEVCLGVNVCGKYQICQEVRGVPNSFWGQYQCINNERSRLLAILTPIIVCLAVCLSLLTLLICLKKRRSRLLKQKLNKKNNKATPGCEDDNRILTTSSKTKPPRSETSSTLLMQVDPSRPDLILNHGQRNLRYPDHSYYQDTSLVNPYISSGQLDTRIASAKLHPKMGVHKHTNPKFMSISNSALQGTDDSTVYRCSHDEYEAVSSRRSSNSQENAKMPLTHLSLLQINPQNFTDRSQSQNEAALHLNKAGLSSSSSSASHRIPRVALRDRQQPQEMFSNNESTFTASVRVEESNNSLSSHDSGHNVFTPTNSSDSVASRSSNCWRKIQWALPPPPPPQSDGQYDYADVNTS